MNFTVEDTTETSLQLKLGLNKNNLISITEIVTMSQIFWKHFLQAYLFPT